MMNKRFICVALLDALASAGAQAGVQSDVDALKPAAHRIADPFLRGLSEGWLEIAERQDSHVLISKVYNDAGARALNNARHFIDGSVAFQPVYSTKRWPQPSRERWVKALQDIERVNQEVIQAPRECRSENAGRFMALSDEAWKEQDETGGTHWVHGWDAVERAHKLGLQVEGEMANCKPPLPPEAPVPVASPLAKPVSLAADALFDFDSAELRPEGQREVTLLANQIRQAGVKLNVLTITGYTDRFGSAAHNRKLSTARAMTVMKALQDQGVSANRFEAHGLGASKPVKSCAGKKATASVIACLAPNRRVEIVAN